MAVEMIGMIGVQPSGEAKGAHVSVIGGGIDKDYVKTFAQTHEKAGFDTVLIGYTSVSADGFSVASYVASVTTYLRFLIAHRPGFVAPTLAARKATTVDHFTDGRIALHIITGGSNDEQAKDGDWLEHDDRYRRTSEYLDVMRETWTRSEPFDYEGQYYQVKQAYSAVKPIQQPHIPIYFGGASGPALEAGGKHADVYALWGEPLAAVKERMSDIQAAAAPYGRTPAFSVSTRPILGRTEGEAWDRAHQILEKVKSSGVAPRAATDTSGALPVGSQRLLKFAADSEVHDRCLWMPISAATGASGNTSALVGTPEQVADALVDYYDLGVKTLLIRGFSPLEDAQAYGEELLPLVRAKVAERDKVLASA